MQGARLRPDTPVLCSDERQAHLPSAEAQHWTRVLEQTSRAALPPPFWRLSRPCQQANLRNTPPEPGCLFAAQTYNNVLHVYGLHWTKEPALPLGGALEGGAGALRRCDLYLQHSVALEQARGPCAWVPVCEASAMCVHRPCCAYRLYTVL